jgi:predicted Ser/Thr protein kinase
VSDREPHHRDTWTRVGDIFHRAVDVPPDERGAFVEQATPDEHIRREVLSLLDAHERASSFIETAAARISPEATPERIGPYLIKGVLGEGGMGVVYLAEDSRLGRTVALKAVAPAFINDATRRERLRREARAAAVLHHPGIATVFALEEIDSHLYIAGEYVPGETLRDELARGPLPPSRAIETTLEVARALAVAHERGVIHRDLKPENLMRTPAGAVKILDFGLARLRDPASSEPQLSGDGTVLGTPAYMSPEQIRGALIDARSDVFALGVVLYELVSGANPFFAGDPASTIARILESDPQPLGIRELDRIVHLSLRKNPNDRFTSAQEFARALEQASAALGALSPSGAARAVRANGAAAAMISTTAPSPSPTAARAVWWWKFHQAAATLGYALLLIPLWRLRDFSEPLGTFLFVGGLVGATAAGGIRLHSWFAADLDRVRWRKEQQQSARWRLAGDVLMTSVLVIEGVVALLARETWGMLLVAASAGVLIAFAVVEPATARAAFDDE